MSKEPEARIRIGISSCLLGVEVRYDGGHKEDRYITGTLGRHFEWVAVCPEFEAGLGVPREAMRLEGGAAAPRLLTIRTRIDHTRAMETFARRRVRELAALDLDGFIFKQDSPSCGMERVRVYGGGGGMPVGRGAGLFARAFIERFPLVPVEEEGRLGDPSLRENFIERVFCHWRWRRLVRAGFTRGRLVAFHTAHKLVLLAHSPRHYQELGRLVAGAAAMRLSELAVRYGELFTEALKVKSTRRKHTNVLMHMAGYFKAQLAREERAEISGVIEDYHRGLVPLIVPITLIRHHLRKLDVSYLREQVYLNPHPKELMLRTQG
jgi:uncharacterized protein YbgA (DUF1722 family)/uncharacterized protein YbbK (DUF523 family)